MTPIGYNVGLISEKRYKEFLQKKSNVEKEIERLKKVNIKPTQEINEFLASQGSTPIEHGIKLYELLKRSEIKYSKTEQIDNNRNNLSEQEKEQVEIQIKYEGYIKLQLTQVEKFKKLETKMIPENIDYINLKGISLEASQKLDKLRPISVGQASRISGVSPADIAVLLIYLEQRKKNK